MQIAEGRIQLSHCVFGRTPYSGEMQIPEVRTRSKTIEFCLLQSAFKDYARDKYAPSDVSTRIFSPSLMNGGTCTMSPVSVFAGLVTLEAVALFSPGSVSTTVSSTVCGRSMPTALRS